jgi:flagellar protein FlaG
LANTPIKSGGENMEVKLARDSLAVRERAEARRNKLRNEQNRFELQEAKSEQLLAEKEQRLLDEKAQDKIKLTNSLDIADKLAKAFNKAIKFQIHDETEKLVVEIVDRETGNVIKQIPPEEMLRIAESVQEFLGLVVDEKA